MLEEIQRSLGRLEGKVGGMVKEQERQGTVLSSIDNRVGAVEKQSAKYGGGAGGLMALIITVGSEILKGQLGR